MDDLGEIFYNGKIINLGNTSSSELQEVLMYLRNDKNNEKEKIENTLENMKK